MAFAITRTVVTPVVAQTINSAATYTSAEVDIGDDTIVEQIWIYLDIASWASAPTGTMIVSIVPIHATGGTAYGDAGVSHPFTVSASAAYAFSIPLSTLPRYFKVTVENNTDVNTGASAVDCRIEYQAVTG